MRLTLLALLHTILWLPMELKANEPVLDLDNLEQSLDSALDEIGRDVDKRVALVDEAYGLLNTLDNPPPHLYPKIQLIEARNNMHVGNFELGQQQLDELCPTVDREQLPDIHFRCYALTAVLQTLAGKRAESLASFEALFAGDISDVSRKLRTQTEISYAVVLNENGKSDEAVDLYDRLMASAVDTNDDETTLYAGNNLIVILITQKDYIAARQTLDRIKPISDRYPQSWVYGSLQLHDYELMRVSGNVKNAIVGLSNFISTKVDPTPLMMGSAHKLLADAYLDAGNLVEAEAASNVALELLMGHAHEIAETRLTRSKIFIAQGQYEAAIEETNLVDLSRESVPTRRVLLHQQRLEALIRMANRPDLLGSFEALVDADEERDRLASTTRSAYFDARLTAAERGRDLREARARVEAQEQQREIDSRNNRLALGITIGSAITLCLFIFLFVSRRSERQLLNEKRAQNEALEVQVSKKTRELTENLTTQAELARELELTRRSEAIGMLAGNVAHDFNNLLQVIAGSNELLADMDNSEAEKTQILNLSNNSVSHAAKIVSQLLAYSRQQILEAQSICLATYLNENLALLQSALGEKSTIKIIDHSRAARIFVDPTQMTTSLLNLISNSADAMPNGGELSITLDRLALDEEHQSQWSDIRPGDYVQITVSDIGQGMTDEQIQMACEPFFTTKDAQSGTGLGLSSVHGFVKQSGGDLKIDSRLGQGTDVRIILPISIKSIHGQEEGTDHQQTEISGLSLLLVEDNDKVASTLSSLIEHLGLVVTWVDSGREAMNMLADGSSFDIVLSDVRMPGEVSGPTLIRWVQQNQPGTTALLMSGFSDLDPMDSDIPLIRKPFTIQAFKDFLTGNRNLESN